METVQERLKYLRTEKLKLTQAEFADKLGFKGASIVNQMESGSRSITDRTVREICSQFQVSKDWLWMGLGDVFTLSVSEPEKAYDPHGGYKPDPEKALGVARGTPHWMAFDFLSKIYASQDQQLIEATFKNLQLFHDAVVDRQKIEELKQKIGQPGRIDKAPILERRSGTDRRQVVGESPTDKERRILGERRTGVGDNGNSI